MWVLEHLDDLDSDFRVFYGYEGIGDEEFPDGMTGPRFFALAHRVAAYEGVMAARAAAEEQENKGGPSRSTGQGPQDQQVSSERAVLTTHPVLSGLIDF